MFSKTLKFISSLENADEIKRTMDAALRAKRIAACKDGYAWVINIPGTSEDQFPGHAWTDLLGSYLKCDVNKITCSTFGCDKILDDKEKKGAHVLVLSKSAGDLYGMVCLVPVCSQCNSLEEPYQVRLRSIVLRDRLVTLGRMIGWTFNDITKP